MLLANPVLVAPAGTVTATGTATAALLLARLTTNPPLAAAPVRLTVHVSVPAPDIEELAHESPLNAAGTGVPIPLRPMMVG